jgi:hypothetical protein
VIFDFLHSSGGLVWTTCTTITHIFLIADISAFGQCCASVNKYSSGKVSLVPITGNFAINLLPVSYYFRFGPDTNINIMLIPRNP